MVSLGLALLCALAWGSADYLGGSAARRVPLYGVVIISQLAGLVVLGAVVPFLGMHVVPAAIVPGLLAGVAGAGGLALLYRGLAIGRMGVVSPITAGLAAATPAAWGLFARGEHLPAVVLAGLGCVIVAVVLISLMPDSRPEGAARGVGPLPAGVAEALVSGVLLGVYMIVLGSLGPDSGLVPLVFARAASVVALLAVAAAGRQKIAVPAPALAAVIGCGLLDITANTSFVIAMHGALLAVVAVISSLYPLSCVALAAIFDRERLLAVQWAGVVLALAGIALIAA